MAGKRKQKVEEVDDEVFRSIEMIAPCAGDIRAVFAVQRRPLFVRVAVWAHVTQSIGDAEETVVLGMVPPSTSIVGDGALVFADEESGFLGYCGPGDDERHWRDIAEKTPEDAEEPGEDA